MLRFWLLGGRPVTLPWEFFVTIGGALLGAGIAFPFLFPLWSSYPIVGFIETGIILCAGVGVVTVGIVRWRSSRRRV